MRDLIHSAVIGSSVFARNLRSLLPKVAAVDAPVLLSGPTGVGKSYLAQVIHQLSPRRNRELVRLNCAAIPHMLLENELFGHEEGAFTGARTRFPGKFQVADKGTLFLDEIAEMPFDLQAKILTVLEDKQFSPLGSTEVVRVDVRIIVATNKNIEQALKQGELREDLFYRLNTFHIQIPPLRERPEDIIPSVLHFKKLLEEKYKFSLTITDDALEYLQNLTWPGNLREIFHFLERVIINGQERVTPLVAQKFIESPQENAPVSVNKIVPLKEAIASYIYQVVQLSESKADAARKLGIDIKTLNKYLNHATTTHQQKKDY